MRIRPGYAGAAIAVLAIELAIAAFVAGGPIRTHAGDVLAVLLVHLGLRAVTPLPSAAAAASALAVALAIEASQWLGMADRLGMAGNPAARIVLGSSFDPIDLIAYAVGAGLALAIEAGCRKRPA